MMKFQFLGTTSTVNYLIDGELVQFPVEFVKDLIKHTEAGFENSSVAKEKPVVIPERKPDPIKATMPVQKQAKTRKYNIDWEYVNGPIEKITDDFIKRVDDAVRAKDTNEFFASMMYGKLLRTAFPIKGEASSMEVAKFMRDRVPSAYPKRKGRKKAAAENRDAKWRSHSGWLYEIFFTEGHEDRDIEEVLGEKVAVLMETMDVSSLHTKYKMSKRVATSA